MDQWRVAQPHEEIGVQVEAIAQQRRLPRGAAAADLAIALDHRDFQAGARQIGRKGEPVVSGSDDDAIESRHCLLPDVALFDFENLTRRKYRPQLFSNHRTFLRYAMSGGLKLVRGG